MTQSLHYAVDGDGIARITIDVPDRPMNVITAQFIAELIGCIERLRDDAAVRGALFISERAEFLVGADLKWVGAMLAERPTAAQALQQCRPLSEALRRLETCGKPIAAALNGSALGGGFELALACHYRVLADTPGAVVGLPEVKVGLLPGAGGTQRLPRLIGIDKALPLLLEGKHVPAPEALKIGMVHAVVPRAELVARARQWLLDSPDPVQAWDKKGFRFPGGASAFNPATAQTFTAGNALLARTTQHNYPAPIAIMACVYEGMIVPIDAALRIESRHFAKLMADPVAANMTNTLFIRKGEADRLARRPADVPKSKVTHLGVLGAGMMGAGITCVAARAGIEVLLLDVTLDQAAHGKRYTAEVLAKDVKRGRLSETEAARILDRIRPTSIYGDLSGCELVIEAVFEDRAIKAEVTRKAEAAIASSSVFASNTSTLPITGLADASIRPAQFIGLHFFSPVDRMPLVEIIVGRQTDKTTLARGLDFVQQLRKTPIIVNDRRGFFTSRVFATFTNEGLSLLGEGVKPALIENAAKMAGMPVGPLAVIDEVSLELAWHVEAQTRADLGQDYVEPSGWAVMRRMVEEHRRLGKRHGQGFYDYPGDGPKRLWPGLAQAFPVKPEQPDVEEIKTRLLVRQALEAARCMEEGVLDHPADADLGSILGIGFPAWTGGVLSYIDMIGIDTFVIECDRLAQRYGARYAPSAGLRERAARGLRFH